MHVCIYVCMHVYMCILYVCACLHMSYMCTWVCICVYAYIHIWLCVYVFLHVCMCERVCVFACVYVWIYVYMCVCVWVPTESDSLRKLNTHPSFLFSFGPSLSFLNRAEIRVSEYCIRVPQALHLLAALRSFKQFLWTGVCHSDSYMETSLLIVTFSIMLNMYIELWNFA